MDSSVSYLQTERLLRSVMALSVIDHNEARFQSEKTKMNHFEVKCTIFYSLFLFVPEGPRKLKMSLVQNIKDTIKNKIMAVSQLFSANFDYIKDNSFG